MAQKVVGYIKLQIPAGKATPAPPVGPLSLIHISETTTLIRIAYAVVCG